MALQTIVMAGHSRSQNGVTSFAYAGHPRLSASFQDVDARDERGHDG
jgi:hypothetical protein